MKDKHTSTIEQDRRTALAPNSTLIRAAHGWPSCCVVPSCRCGWGILMIDKSVFLASRYLARVASKTLGSTA